MTDVELHPPGFVRWATRVLEEAGYETWAVGGAVRNALLGLPYGDWDLATRAPPGVVRRLFPRTVPVGMEHGTVGVLTRGGTLLEVTTFRRDVETYGRKARVEFAQTLQEDLARRDFTVNAIAWHPLHDRFQDPFEGRRDLERRLLRTVGDPGDRFSEDYLRVLRGLRFSGRFRFLIEETTWKALRASVGRLGILSPERIREELMKILSGDPRPSGALSLYALSGVLEALYPEVAGTRGRGRPGREEDLWTFTLLLVDALPPSKPLLRLAAFLQGAAVPDEGVPGGEEVDGGEDPALRGGDRVAALMVRLRFSNAEIRTVTELIRAGLDAPVDVEDPAALRRWLHRSDPDQLPSLTRIWAAAARLDSRRWNLEVGRLVGLLRRLRKEIRSGSPIRSEELDLDGRDLISLGMKPGPHFREILEILMERVLDDPGLNRREILRPMALELAGEERMKTGDGA